MTQPTFVSCCFTNNWSTLFANVTLHMEQFYYTLGYLEGDKNVLVDCFSRLPRMEKISVGKKELDMIKRQKGTVC